jgi:predicted MPP superfamily phosphohydrolase
MARRPAAHHRGDRHVHIGEPYMGMSRIETIVETTNALGADLIVLLGDYTPGHRFITRPVALSDFARAMGRLRAPLGVYAILGNHDWWADPAVQAARGGTPQASRELQAAGIPVLENRAVRLLHGGQPFWLLGLGDQLAFRGRRFRGMDDLPRALAQVSDEAPVLLLAHEPDIFPRGPSRVALTLSGHTHGGQIRVLGYSPFVPSRYGNRYAYGHVIEEGRNLIVSGGLGTSGAPVRLGVPPEIVLVRLAQDGRSVRGRS